jgi:hypothetical protein
MKKTRQKKYNFKNLLEKYLNIKGLDIIVCLRNGDKVELNKNRKLEKDEIVMQDKAHQTIRIPLANVKSIDLFAA